MERERVRDELMNYLRMSDQCYDIVRMRPQAFQGFCDILRRDGGLQDTQRASVEEQVAKFLHIISHNVKNTIFFFAVLVRQLATIFIEC
jgi:4-hydroxyphenylpyruvate dioxygenase-like putative hemolysin